nr:hypothetical protein [Halovulum marinum]
MIAFDPDIQVFAIDVPDRTFWPQIVVDLTDHLGNAVRLVGDDRHWQVQAHGFACLPQESSCRCGITPSRQTEVDQLPELVDGTPQVIPACSNAYIGFVDMPLQPAPRTMGTVGPFADLGAELANPAINGRRIHRNSALCEHVARIST